MVYAKEIYKGRFIPINRQKYLGDFHKIIYRSSYELKFMNWCDRNESIIGWASEELAIPYRSPMDNKVHRYFPDFYIEVKQSEGVQKFLIEVKPDRFTRPPKAGKRKTRRYLQEIANYAVNEAKWLAAKDFSSKQNMVFKLVTEKELGI